MALLEPYLTMVPDILHETGTFIYSLLRNKLMNNRLYLHCRTRPQPTTVVFGQHQSDEDEGGWLVVSNTGRANGQPVPKQLYVDLGYLRRQFVDLGE